MIESILDLKRLNLIKKCCGDEALSQISDILSTLSLPDNQQLNSLLKLFKLMDESNTTNSLEGEPYSVGNREVIIVYNNIGLEDALNHISNSLIVGFDTEQKPVFDKGSSTNKISIVQIATLDRCYIFQLNRLNDITPILELISSKQLIKVGFGLKSDRNELFKHFSIRPNSLIDLQDVLRKLSSRNGIGAKKAVWIFLDKLMKKSKSATMSNWASHELKPSQILYASEDACAPVDVFYKMIKDYPVTTNVMPEWLRDRINELKEP